MTHQELIYLLIEKGFSSGWVLSGTQLVYWEHDQNPPAPLTRPKTDDNG